MHMAKSNPFKRFLAMAAMTLLPLLVAGCGGSSGDAARPDDPLPPPTEPPRVTITNATIASVPVVDFNVVDRDGFPVTGVTQASFTIAKLIPGQDGDSNAWQSYINRVEQPGTGDWPGTEPKIQATAESNGMLLDNGDGTYRYTFETDLTDVRAPLAVSYQPDLTHLIGVQLGGAATGANAIYSFQPSTGRTSSISDRRIVNQETCGSCHGPSLAAHGGSRVDAQYCVTCHNPGTADAQSGETVDFRVMVHKIHMGSDLPSGAPYVLWGFRDSRHDFSNVAHPQDVRNCVNCHDPDNPATPQASQILTHPSVASCGSCHDDVNFETGENHIRGVDMPVANDACTACHSTGGVAGSVLESHAIPAKLASKGFQLNILALELLEDRALVTFSITNPEQDDRAYSVPGPFRALSMRLNWTEEGSSDYSRLLGASTNLLVAPLTDLADGSYRATVSIPQNVAPVDPVLFVVGLEGSAWLDGIAGSEVVRITSSTRFFAPDAIADEPQRRQVVSDALCSSCHEQHEGPFSGHGQNITDHVQLCVMCHNPNFGDITAEHPPNASSADMMFMIHAIHGSEIRGENEYRSFGGLRYPRPSSDCHACHVGDSYELTSVPTDRPPLLIEFDPPTFASPLSSVCWSCHSSTSAEQHISRWLGQINVPEGELLNQELCIGCHGPGAVQDVQQVHGLR
jgi:OmcA/MtrC family decaheme c-type cytochrome